MEQLPPIVEIESTTSCTRNCWFCRSTLNEEDLHRPVFLPKERHDGLIRELADLDYSSWVVYCGIGEPTMHPDLLDFLRLTRALLPNASIAMATNGDLLTVEMMNDFAGLIDSLCWDVYENDDTSRRVGGIVKASRYDPERFVVIDATEFRKHRWITRSSGAWKSPKMAAARHQVCGAMTAKMVFTSRGIFCACCNDGLRQVTWDCSLPELLEHPGRIKMRDDLLDGKRDAYPSCRQCEYVGTPPPWRKDIGLFDFLPAITQTRFWDNGDPQ